MFCSALSQVGGNMTKREREDEQVWKDQHRDEYVKTLDKKIAQSINLGSKNSKGMGGGV